MHARVSVRGARARCFLNDQLLFEGKIDRHRTGCVGLLTANLLTRVRNIKVTDLEGGVLLEGLPDLDSARPAP